MLRNVIDGKLIWTYDFQYTEWNLQSLSSIPCFTSPLLLCRYYNRIMIQCPDFSCYYLSEFKPKESVLGKHRFVVFS